MGFAGNENTPEPNYSQNKKQKNKRENRALSSSTGRSNGKEKTGCEGKKTHYVAHNLSLGRHKVKDVTNGEKK